MSKNRQISELTSKRVPTLKKRSDFLRLRSGKRYSAKTLVLQSVKAASDKKQHEAQVGYTVTKKVGNAVVRNKIRRRLREAVAQVFPSKAHQSHDYVVIGKHGALTGAFASILKDMEQALDHVHKSREKGFKETRKSDDAAKASPTRQKDMQ